MRESMTTRRATPKGLAAAVVALAATLPLLPTLRAGFVYDDTTIVRDNVMLRGWSALGRVWSAPYWPNSGTDVAGLYRPIHVALLSVVWNVGGGSARLFHLYAVVLHLIIALLLWRLLGGGGGRVAATVGALWFATHALHVEAVASVANSSELLVALFTIALAMVIARAGSAEGVAREWAVALLAGALTAGAVLSKESGVFALPVAAVTAWGWRRVTDAPSAPTMARHQARIWVACAASLAIALLARAAVLGAPVAPASIVAPGLDVMTPRERIVTMLSLWPRIAGMVVWPTSLSPYYGPTILPGQRGARAVVAVLVALALAGLAVAQARRGDRRPLVAAVWIALTYLPASNLLTPAGPFIADRTLLGPTIGVALALAWAIDRSATHVRSLLIVLSVALILHDAWASLRYATVWSSHRTLWERLVQTSPAEYRGYQLLGIDAREHGDTTRALSLLARAFAMEPRDRRVRFEYGQVLYSTGRYAAAAEILAPMLRDGDVRREPAFVAMYLDAVGRSRGAEGVVAAGTPLLRSESAALVALYVGMAEEKLGRLAAADSAYATGLRAQPADTLLRSRRAALETRAAPR
jgi:tetratricopeptide (TPR) repeat protein